MRTGVKDKGQSCVALRLCSLAGPLQFDESEVCEAIKRSQCGRTNVVKDFLSPDAKDSYVKRHVNHVSLRAAVVYTSLLSGDLLQKLEKGTVVSIN